MIVEAGSKFYAAKASVVLLITKECDGSFVDDLTLCIFKYEVAVNSEFNLTSCNSF